MLIVYTSSDFEKHRRNDRLTVRLQTTVFDFHDTQDALSSELSEPDDSTALVFKVELKGDVTMTDWGDDLITLPEDALAFLKTTLLHIRNYKLISHQINFTDLHWVSFRDDLHSFNKETNNKIIALLKEVFKDTNVNIYIYSPNVDYTLATYYDKDGNVDGAETTMKNTVFDFGHSTFELKL